MIGYFGGIVFETSDQRILTFSGFTRDTASRWAKHEVLGRKPANEFIGPDLDTVTFTVLLSGKHGVKPRTEAEKWLALSRSGKAETLVLGSRAMGVDKWTVQRVSQVYNIILNRGEVYSASVDVTLEEYVEVLR